MKWLIYPLKTASFGRDSRQRREMVQRCDFNCSSADFYPQSMDSTFVSLLCSTSLWADNDYIVTIKADDGNDFVTFVFESPNMLSQQTPPPLSSQTLVFETTIRENFLLGLFFDSLALFGKHQNWTRFNSSSSFYPIFEWSKCKLDWHRTSFIAIIRMGTNSHVIKNTLPN